MKHDVRELQTFEKPLPVQREAERLVLGVVLLDPGVFEQALDLAPDDFFVDANRRVFEAMLAIHSRGEAIDPLTVQEELRRAGLLEQIGGPAYIATLFEGVPRFSNIETYVGLVRDTARERALIRFGAAVTGRAFDGEMLLDEQLRLAEEELLAVGAGRGGSHWRNIADVAGDVMVEAEKRGESDRMVLDFSTGFCDLDYVTLGFERKTMVVIGGAPGSGKTALGLSMTRQMSESALNLQPDGRPPVIAWFSQEMPNEQQAQRFLASVARVDFRRFRMGYLSKEDWREVANAQRQMQKWRVHFDDRPGLSPRKMREAVRRLKNREGRVDLVFVDYIQLSDGERQKNETREGEVAKISRGLLQIAKDYDLTVVALSQLNRKLEDRKDKRPNMGDFRDSGQIAQDGYLVMGLYRDQVYNPETPKQNIAELIILKQRNGPLATVELVFLSQVMRVEDVWRPQA
jgi:replicative DNA helicase